MRLIIAGSRDITDLGLVRQAVLSSGIIPTVIISGGARGVDSLGEVLAREMDIPIDRHPADWDKHGRSAGYIRNAEMAEVADALVAIWDGVSRGTESMINLANKKGLKVYVERIGEGEG
jgi:hypothetical protein